MNIAEIKRRGYGQCHFMRKAFAEQYFNTFEVNEEAEDRERLASLEYATWRLRPDGTAVIPINGVLFHGSTFWPGSYYQGYNTIAANAMDALAAQPERVALIVDSNGGEVDGCFACARKLRDMFDAAGIPVWAFSNESMYSAAYAIGSQADRIILPSSAGVASVGVVSTTVSYAKMLEDIGIQVNLVTSGDKKAVGNPYQELSEEDRAEIQARVDKYAGLFFDVVSQTRPMSVEQIESAQANIFIGDDAVEGEFKFADEVMDLDDFFFAFSQENSNTQIFTGESTMNKEDLQALQDKAARVDSLEAENKDLKTQVSDQSSKIVELEASVTELDGKLTTEVEQANAAHTRYVAVMESEEAEGRQDHAKRMLADTKFGAFTAEDICEQLTSMAKVESSSDDDDDDKTEGKGSKTVDKMLASAREKDSDTKDITNRGNDNDKKASGGSDDVDDNGRAKSESYQSELSDDEDENNDAMKRSAAIVKNNRKSRKQI